MDATRGFLSRHAKHSIEPRAVLREEILRLLFQFRGLRVAEEERELAEFAWVGRQLVAALLIHQADARFDAYLEAIALAKIVRVFLREITGGFEAVDSVNRGDAF